MQRSSAKHRIALFFVVSLLQAPQRLNFGDAKTPANTAKRFSHSGAVASAASAPDFEPETPSPLRRGREEARTGGDGRTLSSFRYNDVLPEEPLPRDSPRTRSRSQPPPRSASKDKEQLQHPQTQAQEAPTLQRHHRGPLQPLHQHPPNPLSASRTPANQGRLPQVLTMTPFQV